VTHGHRVESNPRHSQRGRGNGGRSAFKTGQLSDLTPSTLNPQPSTLNTQHSTLNTQLSTLCAGWRATLDKVSGGGAAADDKAGAAASDKAPCTQTPIPNSINLQPWGQSPQTS
jgi:hypothetical protein